MPDWDALFTSTVPVLELLVRGTVMYLGLVVLLRVIGQRESGGLTITDLLVVVLIGEAATHSLAGDSLSLPEGLVLAATMLGWSLVLDALAYRFPGLGRLVKARPRPLILDGQVNRKALRRELLTRDELEEQLRLHGVDDVTEVKWAYLEPNGMISVFKRDERDGATSPPPG